RDGDVSGKPQREARIEDRSVGAVVPTREGWQGWDEYAPFYDWENAQTLGRRDVPFWRRVASAARGPVLELGCGTGRVSLPISRPRSNRSRASSSAAARSGSISCQTSRDGRSTRTACSSAAEPAARSSRSSNRWPTIAGGV